MRRAIARELEPKGQTRGENCDLPTKMPTLSGTLNLKTAVERAEDSRFKVQPKNGSCP